MPRSDPLDFDAGAKCVNVLYVLYALCVELSHTAHVSCCSECALYAVFSRTRAAVSVSSCTLRCFRLLGSTRYSRRSPLTLFNYAGYTGPLDSCSIYGSGTAGDMLRQMLRSGASLPWQDVLRAMTGSSSMSTRPILRYFKPLYDFLYRHNRLQPTAIGWGDDFYMSSPSQTTPGSPSSSDSSSSPAGSVVLSLVLVLIILWIAFKTRRQIRMRQRPIVEFEDMNEFGYSLSGRRFNQI